VLTQHFHAREDTRLGNGVERSATELAPKLENSFNAAKVALHNNRQTVSTVGAELLGFLLMAWASASVSATQRYVRTLDCR